jgi:hypothetical protein
VRTFFLTLILTCLATLPAFAGNIEVSVVEEENESSMELQNRAMNEAFAEAVHKEALRLLPPLGEKRSALLREELKEKAGYYVLGYDKVQTEPSEDGLTMRMNVKINRQALRDGLKAMGVFSTARERLSTDVRVKGLNEEDRMKLKGLMLLTGIDPSSDVDSPAIMISKDEKEMFDAQMRIPGRVWRGRGKDLGVVWNDLWKRYFTRQMAQAPKTGMATLRIAGWFTPDGVREFDRILRKWDGALSDVQLLELDMQASGVSGIWSAHILNRELLTGRLEAFLPDRGLSYSIDEKADENDS